MPTIKYVQAEFTPAEVAAITGVSAELQRAWRLRKILPRSKTAKHKRFRASELGELLALKAFSDAGVSIERMKSAASVATGPVWSVIANAIAEAVYPAGGLIGSMDGVENRYVIVRGERILRTGDLAALNASDDRCLVTHVFDCLAAAELIAERAPRPCMSVEVSP